MSEGAGVRLTDEEDGRCCGGAVLPVLTVSPNYFDVWDGVLFGTKRFHHRMSISKRSGDYFSFLLASGKLGVFHVCIRAIGISKLSRGQFPWFET